MLWQKWQVRSSVRILHHHDGRQAVHIPAFVPQCLKSNGGHQRIGSNLLPVCAGASIHPHLGAIFPPVLALASQRGKDDPASLAAQDVTRRVTAAVAEDGSYLLVAQVWLS